MITNSMVTASLQPFIDKPSIQCVNLVSRINSLDDFNDVNCIKVAISSSQRALYFSRSPIPHSAEFSDLKAYRQVCIIPFSAGAIQKFTELPPSNNEIYESVDMNRFLDHGIPVQLVETSEISYPVDTPADLIKVKNLMSPN